MKMKQFPRKIQDRSLFGNGSTRYTHAKIYSHERFAFGDACGIDRKFGGPNIPKTICLDCRKLTRRAWICPDCGGYTTSTGTPMFKTPRRSDKRSWKKLREILT